MLGLESDWAEGSSVAGWSVRARENAPSVGLFEQPQAVEKPCSTLGWCSTQIPFPFLSVLGSACPKLVVPPPVPLPPPPTCRLIIHWRNENGTWKWAPQTGQPAAPFIFKRDLLLGLGWGGLQHVAAQEAIWVEEGPRRGGAGWSR